MSNVLLLATTVVDPQSTYHLQEVDIRIVAGTIQEIEKAGKLSPKADEKIVESSNVHVSPGWFDMQTHLNDPGYEWKENLHQLTQAAVQGGFTEILCLPNTSPVVDQGQMVHALTARAKQNPVSVHFCGSLTSGAAGKELAEIYDMQSAGALAFTDGTHPLQHSGLILRALQYMQAFDGLMIHYPSDYTLSRGGQMNEGVMATKLGMPGVPELAESTSLTKFLHLLEYAGGRAHLHPISGSKSIHILEQSKSQFPNLTIGTNVAYLSMNDELLNDFDPNYKIFPPIRNEQQRQTLCEAIQKGLIDTISSGHWAQSIEEKQMEFASAEPGILSLQTFFAQANKYLIQNGIIDLSRLIELISINPRKILKQPPVVIKKGEYANMSIFQSDENWTFSSQHIFSRAHNSPLLNQPLSGKVLGIYHKELLHLATD